MTKTEGMAFSERVACIRKRFLSEMPQRVRTISDVLAGIEDEDTEESRSRMLHRMLHDIAGSAAMLELYDIEVAARRGLAIAEVSDDRGTPLDEESRSVIQESVCDMLAVATSKLADC